MVQSDTVQIHDFEPGIAPSGLFWTVPFPADQVSIDLGSGTASYEATNWAINDYTNFGNAIGDATPPIPVIPAMVSFKVNWTANGKPTQLPNKATPTTGFAGLFINSSAQVWWSAEEPTAAFRFVSDPAASSWTISGVIGKEQNGRFYPPGA